MSRPKIGPQITVRVPAALQKRVRRLAKKHKIQMAEMWRIVLDSGTERVETAKSLTHWGIAR